MRKLKVGTRGSMLALRQTEIVASMLQGMHPGLDIEIVIIKTRGDKILDIPLEKIDDKGFFVKELETALLCEEIDFAVHSMKDLPSDMPDGLCIAAVPERVDPSDVLISNGPGLDDLPENSLIGCGSLRRQAQLQEYRPDLRFGEIRGNVDTRLRKLDADEFDAVVLAYAGFHRLGWEDRVTEKIPWEICLPSVGQGALAVQSRASDEELLSLLKAIDRPECRKAVAAERALMQAMGGGCQFPLGGLAVVNNQELILSGVYAPEIGKPLVRSKVSGKPEDGEMLGRSLAEKLVDLQRSTNGFQ